MADYIYEAFGYRIASDILMPELTPAVMIDDEPDVCITRMAYEELLPMVPTIGNRGHTYVSKDRFGFLVPDLAIYVVERGKSISYAPLDHASEDQIRIFLLGTCMGALLIQRKVLPLHGSAVVIDGHAYAIIGDSGAGKSTLAASFAEAGYKLLTDDVIAIHWDDSAGQPMVVPAYPQQKLWKESIEQIGIQTEGVRPLYHEADKYAVQIQEKFTRESYPLAGIFELTWGNGDEIDIKPIQLLHRLPLLWKHTYRNFLVPGMQLQQWHFMMSSRVSSRSFVYSIRRPTNTFSAIHLVSWIQQIINEGSERCVNNDRDRRSYHEEKSISH